jgi:hypothetical protein
MKNAKVVHFQFEDTLSLVGGIILDRSMGRYVLDVCFIIKRFSHSLYSSDFSCSMQDAISFRDLFFHLATLFCYGVYGTVCCN